ncbi:MAG TPA: DnaJ C-terminal domain-containing protein [Steroidobacteraceae bacterium]|jgi:curved DNA-binding protein|nr:DnaJ C-terminal domain-containing protein [Steroidobacteraceae bacterium]
MQYKDYYAILGLARGANDEEIKRAYRKLARKYHPDVSKEPGAEEKFKEVAEAYQTLKDPDKRTAYDQLGAHRSGEEFRPPPDWQQQWKGSFGEAPFAAEQMDLADLFAHLGAGVRSGARRAMPGQDFEISVPITVEEAYGGTEINLDLNMPEYDEHGQLRRVPHAFKARIPKGATDGQRLRIPGKGGRGLNGGRNGDLYLDIALRAHPLYRAAGHDLYIDLPLAPWEAVLGTAVEVPTPAGRVRLKIPAGTQAGQHLRLPRRGLPKPKGGQGDLYAIVQIVVPSVAGEPERALYQQLAAASAFDPRAHLAQEAGHAG